jgi:predicted ATPase
MVSASRLATLTGPGGVGQTRLALKVAADVRRAFSDGVWLVELEQLQTVAESLGLRQQSGRAPMAALAEFLAQRQVLLLVLDNCEHLVDAVAVLADALLRSRPQLRILATSGAPLGIGGQLAFSAWLYRRVPPLPLPVRPVRDRNWWSSPPARRSPPEPMVRTRQTRVRYLDT